MLRWAQGVARRLDPDRTRDDDGAAPLGDDDGAIGKKPSPPRAPAPTLRAHGCAAIRAPKESCATLSAIISAALSATSPLASLPPSSSLSLTHNSYLVHYISFPSLVSISFITSHSHLSCPCHPSLVTLSLNSHLLLHSHRLLPYPNCTPPLPHLYTIFITDSYMYDINEPGGKNRRAPQSRSSRGSDPTSRRGPGRTRRPPPPSRPPGHKHPSPPPSPRSFADGLQAKHLSHSNTSRSFRAFLSPDVPDVTRPILRIYICIYQRIPLFHPR